MPPRPKVGMKRVYDEPSPEDGQRILIDRLWPRGVSRKSARLDQWRKDLAPSDDLRRWFGHDPGRFRDFRTRYRRELRDRSVALDELVHRAMRGPLTLLFGARDRDHSNAAVLKELLEEKLRARPSRRWNRPRSSNGPWAAGPGPRTGPLKRGPASRRARGTRSASCASSATDPGRAGKG